jgi:hypothetical protein
MSVPDLIDRGAVLFVGIAVGAVLLLAFQTDGKPLAPLLSNHTADTPALVPQAIAAKGVAAPDCHDDFPFSRSVLAGLRANRPLRIGILGDSFGEGVWAATNQHFHGNPDFAVYRMSKEATGFTRYRSLDLLEDLKSRLAKQPIDIALIDFGANDTQGIWQDGTGAAYMSGRWQAAIGDKVSAYVGYLRDRGVAVGWVGLPRMRRAEFDTDVQAMNRFYAGLMCKLHVPFVNPVGVSEDAGHGFAKELVDPASGRSYLARADDGIHMTFHGYEVIARPLLQRIAVLGSQDQDEADNAGPANDPTGRAE